MKSPIKIRLRHGQRIIPKLVLKNRVGGCGLDLSGSGRVPAARYGEYNNKVAGSIKV